MYSIAWFLLVLLLLIFPALAIMPRLVFSAKTAIAVPVLSSLLLYLLKEIFYLFSAYNTTSFRILVVLFAGVAFVRLRKEMKTKNFDWNEKQILCYLFNFLLLLPLLLWFWTTPYDTPADSVTSWDMWAQQHYLGVRPDFFYTIYPYPQAFSVYISNIYTVWGSADYHQLARSLFFIFPYCVLTTLSLSFAENSRSKYTPLLFSLGMYGLFFWLAFSYSCADTMMAAAVLTSAFYTLLWHKERIPEYIWLSASGALLAILAKQQAVFWTVLAWPALLLFMGNFHTARKPILLSIGGVFFIAVAWLVLEGEILRAFNNQMAMGQSFGNRNIFGQFLHGSKLVFAYFPFTLVLLLITANLSRDHKEIRIVSVLFVIPSLAAWIMFGAYSTARSGIHLVAVMAMIAAFYASPNRRFSLKFFKNLQSKKITRGDRQLPLKVISTCLGLVFIVSFEGSNFSRSYPLDGGHRNTIVKLNKIAAPEKFDHFYYQEDIKMFTQNEMINSIMLRRAKIARPPHGSTELDMLNLMESSGSDTLFPYPPPSDRTPLGITVDNLAWFCPRLFSPKLTDYDLEIYAINRDQIESCRQTLLTRRYFISTEPVSLY